MLKQYGRDGGENGAFNNLCSFKLHYHLASSQSSKTEKNCSVCLDGEMYMGIIGNLRQFFFRRSSMNLDLLLGDLCPIIYVPH